MDLIHKIFESEVKAFNDEELTIEHFISTEQVDRSKDIMRADGMKMDGVPTVLKQHGFDTDTGSEPIAKPLSINVSRTEEGKKGILVKTQYFNGGSLTPPDNTGERLYKKAKDNFMPYWSIGFRGLDAVPRPGGGTEYKEWSLHEYSQVGVPDNVGAKVVKSMEHKELMEGKENKIFSFAIEKEEENNTEVPKPVFKDIQSIQESEYFENIQSVCKESGLTLEEFNSGLVECAKDGLNLKDMLEKIKELNTIETNLKSIRDRVAEEIPWDAMRSIWFGMLDELYMADGSEKATKAILKELIEILTPFAQAYNIATSDLDNDSIELKNYKTQITEESYIDEKDLSAEPAPDKTVNTDTPPQKASPIMTSLLNLKDSKKTIKSQIPFSVDALKDAVKSTFQETANEIMDKMKGKVKI